MSILFSPLNMRTLTFRNKIFVSPMCQYSSHDGLPTDWHLVHLGSRAVGGAGLVMVEATAVTPEGRISPGDSGIWSDAHTKAFAPITRFLREQVPFGPGFQVPFAARIRAEAGIASGAVGFITEPAQAEQIVATGQADVVFLARQMLRDPYGPLHAAKALHAGTPWPNQYLQAK